VKALLLVASEPRLQSMELSERHAEVERLLVDMGAATHGSSAGVLDTTMNPDTSIQELIRIKDLAKVLAKEADDSGHLEAARLLYHVSVASAFLRHGATISGRPGRKQRPLYNTLAEKWAGHPIGELFRRMAASSPDE
jgi:hypothetical protein